ncbi:SpoIIE family protein phosphatase [Curtobacterium sp. 458]|uniref:PP2C family protein-serine/threonine phosphatase n=1 Tax=Curtobacterium sp. 458 TaxID=3050069 RepID=UPI0025B2D031|nr:SpoIIE family protein phosphatase [Curtobacterium sp. 458]WJX98542.1 SpoIIE family protein phosphatase [Curtobacterium sp. 458]
MTQAPPRRTVRATDTGPIVLSGLRAAWEPLAKQALVAALIVGAAAASTLLPVWLTVTDATAMWTGAGLAVVLLGLAALMARSTRLARAEIVIPLLDFVAVGLLRFGTGETRSVFLAILVLPVVWIAAGHGRWRVLVPVLGVFVTILLPLALAPGRAFPGSEVVRLVIAAVVYSAAAAVVNELSRRSLAQLTVAQRSRRVAEAEVTQAAIVQRSLQPVDGNGLPSAIRVAGTCVPARTVGGDFYDWYPTPDGGMGFTLGDVMGKGVGAGMIAAAVRAVIRSSLEEPDPALAFRWTSAGLSTGSVDMVSAQFTTCFHGRISVDGTLRWVDAGHGLTLVRRAAGGSEFLRSGHLPLGVGSGWTSVETDLQPGDSVVSVSDGVLDLFGGDLASLDRWQAFVDARDDIDGLVADVAALAERGDRADDVTIIAVTWGGSHPA